VWVIVLSTITLSVYAWFWWYYVNRELRDLGRARGAPELGDNPALSALAVSLGSLVVVPPFVSAYNGCRRIQAAQRLSGQPEALNGWIALALFVLIFITGIPFAFGFIQSELNKVWRNEQITEPVAPGLPHPGAQATLPATARPAPVRADWYPDPWGLSRLRYWDGRGWTGHTAD
jgi:Domain of unknown function (DUF4234)/Protein of unknown function (DUF2510)